MLTGLPLGLPAVFSDPDSRKLGIGKTRGHHALITVLYGGRVAAFNVAEGDEVGQQAAVGIFNRKVFLVDLHGGNQHFSG
jgi:hypothetical protein